jgi:peptidoglycan/xylan/chitin deacetylase (PgdA/CDA1 family)
MASVQALTDRLAVAGGSSLATDASRVEGGVVGGARARARARAGADVLTWDELRRLAVAGLAVAPHSRTHALLTRLEPERVTEELDGARRDLEDRLGSTAFGTVFAYPAGHHDRETRAALARLGFELAFTTERGINEIGTSDPLRLRRINVGLRAGPELVRAQMAFLTLRYRARGI